MVTFSPMAISSRSLHLSFTNSMDKVCGYFSSGVSIHISILENFSVTWIFSLIAATLPEMVI